MQITLVCRIYQKLMARYLPSQVDLHHNWEREGTLPKASCGGDSKKPNKSMRQFSWSPAHNSHTFYLGRLQEFPFEVEIFENLSLLNSWQISCAFQLLQRENWTLQSYFKYLLVYKYRKMKSLRWQRKWGFSILFVQSRWVVRALNLQGLPQGMTKVKRFSWARNFTKKW